MTLYLYIVGTILAFCLWDEVYSRPTPMPSWLQTAIKAFVVLWWPVLTPVLLTWAIVRKIRAQ
jgi:hypothetical protein